MRKWNELSTKEKTLWIAIPVIVILLIIFGFMFLGKNDTKDTLSSNVETSENTTDVSKDYTLDVDTIIKDSEPTTVPVTTEEPETIEIPETDVPETEEASETENSEIEVSKSETSTEANSSNENSSSSEVYNGDAADIETLYQENLHKWTTGTVWTASNGVSIKINDAWADAIKAGDAGDSAAVWYEDPDIDPTPNSPYMNALNEFIYGTDEAYLNGKDRWNSEVVDVSKLPDITLASSKQTSVVETNESRAYKDAFDVMYGFQATGKWQANPGALLQFGYSGGKGIGLTTFEGASGYIWTIEYNGSEWVVTINRNLSELQWDALHNSLRLLSPDGDSIYNAVYEDCYVGMTIPDFETWYNISTLYNVSCNSEIYVTNTNGAGYMEYRFR